MKICKGCNVEKSFQEYSPHKSSRDGYNTRCKKCMTLYRLAKPKQYQQTQDTWRSKNQKLLNTKQLEKYYNDKQRFLEYINKTQTKLPPGVYKITCLVNNKCYIGQSIRPYKRIISDHLSIHINVGMKTSILLQNDLKKYGRDNFTYEMLEHCEPELLLEREAYYIQIFKPEYNKNA